MYLEFEFTKKKKTAIKKTRRCPIGNLITYRTPSSFFDCSFFYLVSFCEQNPASEVDQEHSTRVCSPVRFGRKSNVRSEHALRSGCVALERVHMCI
jgi:hypothetical protein